MKFKSSYKLRKAAGENIVMVFGEESKKYNGVIILNESSAFLWNEIEQNGSDEKELVEALKSEYGIDDETATRGVGKFVKLIKEHQFLEQ